MSLSDKAAEHFSAQRASQGYTGGWICPNCNTWVGEGSYHHCIPRAPYYAGQGLSVDAELARIGDLLEEICKLLREMAYPSHLPTNERRTTGACSCNGPADTGGYCTRCGSPKTGALAT
jgi:hypothetical protein